MLEDMRFIMFAWSFHFNLLGMDFFERVAWGGDFHGLFCLGTPFWHLFCLGICVGWICLGCDTGSPGESWVNLEEIVNRPNLVPLEAQ